MADRQPIIPEPPATPARPVTEVLHGETITDAYRWLETVGRDTLAWVHQQNRYTDTVLGARPEVQSMRRQLSQVLSEGDRYMAPDAVSGHLFFKRRRAGEEQPILMVKTGEDDPGRILFDPAGEPYQPSSLDWYVPSPSGRYVALGVSRDGSEDSTIRILDTQTASELPDQIRHARFSSIEWQQDDTAFYYTRHPEAGEVPPGEEMYHQHLRYHILGTPPAQDRDLFGEGRPLRDGHWARLSEDGRSLYLFSGDGWRRVDVFRLDLCAPGASFEPLVQGYDATFDGTEHQGRLLLRTNHGAPRYRIVAVNPDYPQESAWQNVVPETDLVIREFEVSGDVMAVHALKDVTSTVFLLDLATGARTAVSLPGHGTVSSLTRGPGDDFLFMFESFVKAPTLYRLDARDGHRTRLAASTTSSLVEGLTIRQEFYTSFDGTRCPLYLVHRTDLGPGPHPTLLTGYGGFNISLGSHYIPDMLPWVAAGGVFVQANMRGGGEYGDDWHRAAMEANRQKSFDDFEAAARYLIQREITDSAHLGVSGRSLGGLLTGALLTQHPDLVAAVVSGVPLLDMLRYHLFLIGALWIVEYGSPEVPEEFAWIRAYSPYHNVRDGVAYPATYFIGAMNDGRVDALHARKMTARLQAATRGVAGAGPILLRTHFNAGHGAGKPVQAVVDDQAETWGFLAWRLGLQLGS